MAEEGKKISFGFAKSIKKPVLKTTAPQEEKKVDYIECLDEKGIKVIGEEEKKDAPLVIPLLGSRTWHDRIVNKIDADIFEPKVDKVKTEDDIIKQEEKSELSNGNALPKETSIKIKEEPIEDAETVVTLEEQAAKEILEDLKSTEKKENETNELTLPLAEQELLRGQEQSTLEDYEKIPVDAFGVAMLRGMGWQPGKGIGKNEKIVSAVVPELRPKGMGLGADKVTLQKQKVDSKKQEEELKIEKGTFVKLIAGKHSNSYGQIEGFDEDAGRLIIKLALGGNIISVNEFMVQPVTKSEYSKNAKVLNAKKYEEYKDKASKEHKPKAATRESSLEDSESSEEDRNNIEEKRKKSSAHDKNKNNKTEDKKSKSRKRYSDSNSDSDSDYGKRRRKEKSSSDNSDSYKSKRSKKSKKHKRHDSSPERSSKKHKKKDKEREKTRDRKSRDYTDKRKHKKRDRSRSRSSSRR